VKVKGSIFEIIYRRCVPRLGHNQAIGVIIAHRQCRLIWLILHQGARYEERGPAVSKQSRYQDRTTESSSQPSTGVVIFDCEIRARSVVLKKPICQLKALISTDRGKPPASRLRNRNLRAARHHFSMSVTACYRQIRPEAKVGLIISMTQCYDDVT
jgi:hypothetical protein